ncbi:hypothetical protein BOSEA31B_14623 [Hyphomicrobiales bacterium]|nr:hypothetical protein BOSEA31B_14623 [Hyphomicrobiales bacterium]CAH1701116.1 hypothetical protein BOSEA1005_20815 [Hyphomicrobiales bacterium]CAI0345081.1 hypothetical protein BO1005MUT1_360006 [Hyphomicrobiales bacterium]
MCHRARLNRVGDVPVASRINRIAPRTATTPAPAESVGRQGRRRSDRHRSGRQEQPSWRRRSRAT